MIASTPSMPAWLVGSAFLLAIGWLLPNHSPPWSTLHMDAWVAACLLLTAGVVLLRHRVAVGWRGLPLLVAGLILVPALQWATGQIALAGIAWINAAYLLGVLLALLAGAHWETVQPGRALDTLFLAIGMAAFVSVGLQLSQWLYLNLESPWILVDNFNRPFANFGQPNQLATFLVWGLLALAWAWLRRQLGAVVGVLAAVFLLFGLALTASRTSWIAVSILVIAVWAWRGHWPNRRLPVVVTGLALVFVGFVMSVTVLQHLLLGGAKSMPQELTRIVITGENRPAIWHMFLDASWLRPWVGYGWGQVARAQLDVALQHTPKFGVFGQAHNLALDLVLWCGWPLGLAVTAWVGWWLWRRLTQVASAEHAVLALFLLVVGSHAMLELPLHHAYFLLPVGLAAGVLDARLGTRALFSMSRWLVGGLGSVAALLLTLIVLDYGRMEPEYQQLRYEWAHIAGPRAQPPEVTLMTQFPAFVRMVQLEPAAGMDAARLQWMRDVTALYPRPAMLQKLAQALALNGQPKEAAHWLRTLCKVAVAQQCEAARAAWASMAADSPAIAAVPWPETIGSDAATR